MTNQVNPSISVDCVVFGFDGENLKVLLVPMPALFTEKKLPGDMIKENESIPQAVERTLYELTGIKNIYMKQACIFSDPNRLNNENLKVVNSHYQINTPRVITISYYAIVKLTDKILSYTRKKNAVWENIDNIKRLVFDHMDILASTLSTLYDDLETEPIAFELLPRKFTIRQVQNIYASILGIEIDNRNFRKKLLESNFLLPTYEREEKVNHKPALYYTFNKSAYRKAKKHSRILKFA